MTVKVREDAYAPMTASQSSALQPAALLKGRKRTQLDRLKSLGLIRVDLLWELVRYADLVHLAGPASASQ